jgi:hypothetical protein
MSDTQVIKAPTRQVNHEYLIGLDVLSQKEYPLPGATIRGGDRDPRFLHLAPGTAEALLFTHLATVRHRASGMVFVAFKKTMDALHLEQSDTSKYPKWLMDSDVKKSELDIYIHAVMSPYNTDPRLVTKDRSITDVGGQTRVHKWLSEITTPWVFDTVAYFLLKNNIISQEWYGKIK